MLRRTVRIVGRSHSWLLVGVSALCLAGCASASDDSQTNPADAGDKGGGGTQVGAGGTGGPLGVGGTTGVGTGGGQGGGTTASGTGGRTSPPDTSIPDAGAPTDSPVAPADAAADRAISDVAGPSDGGVGLIDGLGGLAEVASGCPLQLAGPFGVRSAHSAGYRGTLTAYSELYNVSCTNLDACVSSCVTAGGTTGSCTQGSECVEGSGGKHCLPPTYWRYEDQALSADGETAEQTLVKIAYQDPLLLSDFGVQLPSDATIRGITFEVLRGTDSQAMAVDFAVRAMRAGQPVGVDHKLTAKWPMTLTWASYGGDTDDWGTTWQHADVVDPGFGLSLAVAYTETAGNARAYVDHARVSIYYTQGCASGF